MRIGSFTAFRASTSECKEPWKCVGSVKTDMPTAPPFSIALASSAASKFFLITPADGEAALISVITGTVLLFRIAFFKLIGAVLVWIGPS